jgi:hypothetical protein
LLFSFLLKNKKRAFSQIALDRGIAKHPLVEQKGKHPVTGAFLLTVLLTKNWRFSIKNESKITLTKYI